MFKPGVNVHINVNNSLVSILTNRLVFFNENMLYLSLKISYKIMVLIACHASCQILVSGEYR